MSSSGIERRRRYFGAIVLLALVSWLAYAAIARLSCQFAHHEQFTERPILTVLGLLGVNFVCYLAAIAIAVRAGEGRWLLRLIIFWSVIFRLTLLCSWPIQEVDIYRYLWDGAATTSGVSPFRYSPQQVLAQSPTAELPPELRKLVELRDRSPSVAMILSRVHYGELPTIYPPVSQAVFAASTLVTPRDSSVLERIVIMKACLLLFDLGTLALVIGLLRLTGWHVGWSLAYGWCPLVIKEIANTGHLDVVAMFFTTFAVFLTVRGLFDPAKVGSLQRHPLARAAIAAALLALAVGAKLYAVVLMPLFLVAWIRHLGWRRAAVPTIVSGSMVAAVLWPMARSPSVRPPVVGSAGAVSDHVLPAHSQRHVPCPSDGRPGDLVAAEPQDPSRALKAFLGRWEMNDFLFLLAVENLKPLDDTPPGERPWFAVVPEAWRLWLLRAPVEWLQTDLSSAAFLLARCVTGTVFLVLALLLAWRGGRSEDPVVWLRAAFLTLAWFWLLSPTQNPWYWLWALPLVMFARSRAWLALSGLTLIYYLRFWLAYHWPDAPVPGTSYHGTLFFDYVVTWLEFGPWLIWLTVDALRRRAWKRGKLCAISQTGERPPATIG